MLNNNNKNKKEKKNYFDYENTNVIEHFNTSRAGIYSSICCVLLLIFMTITASFSNRGFYQSFIQFEAIILLFHLLGSLLQAVSQQGGNKSRFDRGE